LIQRKCSLQTSVFEAECIGKIPLLFTSRHFWNRKCRKKTWWQQEFAGEWLTNKMACGYNNIRLPEWADRQQKLAELLVGDRKRKSNSLSKR
ncbi:hypothetical protein, partial [Clostridium fessum]|uniref:hypothetical protein n=2 Tax=Clostridium fessum TaxID=2126740 RepID=UPI003AEFB593